jgi:hypothetical protein
VVTNRFFLASFRVLLGRRVIHGIPKAMLKPAERLEVVEEFLRNVEDVDLIEANLS